jgi:hypothetical protein
MKFEKLVLGEKYSAYRSGKRVHTGRVDRKTIKEMRDKIFDFNSRDHQWARMGWDKAEALYMQELESAERQIEVLREQVRITQGAIIKTVERYDCYFCPKKPCTLTDNCSGFYCYNATQQIQAALDKQINRSKEHNEGESK